MIYSVKYINSMSNATIASEPRNKQIVINGEGREKVVDTYKKLESKNTPDIEN